MGVATSTLLYLGLEEQSGSSFADRSPFGHVTTGTTSGLAVGTTGRVGRAINFTGGWLQVGTAQFPHVPYVAIEAWIQPQQGTMTTPRAIAARPSAYSLRQTPGAAPSVAELNFNVVTASGAQCSVTTVGNALAQNTWAHVSGWYDGLFVHLAVNGQPRASVPCVGGWLATPATGVFVGAASSVGTDAYGGLIDELQVREVVSQPRPTRYLSPMILATRGNTYTVTHGLGAMPTRCEAFWSLSATGGTRRRLTDFQQDCYATGATPVWRGGDLEMTTTTVSVSLLSTGVPFCYYDGDSWPSAVQAFIQFVCEL